MVGIISSIVLETGGRPLHITWLKKLAGLLSDPRRDELTRLLGVTRVVKWCGLLNKPRWSKLTRPLSVPLVVDWNGLRVSLLWNERACSKLRLSHHEVVKNRPVRYGSVSG